MEPLLTILLGALAGSVPVIVTKLLDRRGANKQLELQERSTDSTVTAAEKAGWAGERKGWIEERTALREEFSVMFNGMKSSYEGLLTRQNDSLEQAETKIVKLEQRVEDLEVADRHKSEELDTTNEKVELLRRTFKAYVERTGVPLTETEQEILERTIPSPRLRGD